MSDPKTPQPKFITPKAGAGTSTGSAGLFDLKPFDDAIAQRGVKLIHMSGMPCPVGRLSRTDSTRRSHADHTGCQGGYIYRPMGQVTCLFSSNSRSPSFQDQGIADNDRVSCTLPRFYDDKPGVPVRAMPFDRLYLAESSLVVINWELNEWSETPYDSFKFPVVEVESLIDYQGQVYQQDEDFVVEQGKIKWGTRSPGICPETGTGALYSVRYTYHPFYIISSLGHELRVANQLDALGNKQIVPMPQAVSLVRENLRRTSDYDPESPAPESRQQLPDDE